jgi:hypothetical protein
MGNDGNQQILAGLSTTTLSVASDPIWGGTYDVYSFCVEDKGQPIDDNTSGYSLYDLTDPFTSAAWLMDQYLASTDTNHEAASLQVAIWESVLDPGASDLSGGNFYIIDPGPLSGDTPWDSSLADQYLLALGSINLASWSSDIYRVVSDDGLATSDIYQDFIVTAVPIPGAFWLLASVVGVVALKKKREKRP